MKFTSLVPFDEFDGKCKAKRIILVSKSRLKERPIAPHRENFKTAEACNKNEKRLKSTKISHIVKKGSEGHTLFTVLCFINHYSTAAMKLNGSATQTYTACDVATAFSTLQRHSIAEIIQKIKSRSRR